MVYRLCLLILVIIFSLSSLFANSPVVIAQEAEKEHLVKNSSSTSDNSSAKKTEGMSEDTEKKEKDAPDIFRINGMKVRLKNTKGSPFVDITLATRIKVEPNATVLTLLTSAMLQQVAPVGINPAEFQATMKKNGISFEVTSDPSFFNLHMTAPYEHLEIVLNILSGILTSPAYTEELFQSVFNEFKVFLKTRSNSPIEVSLDKLHQELFGKSPYGSKIDNEFMSKLTLSDIKAFHANQFVANRSFILILSPGSNAEVSRLTQSVFQNWKKAEDGDSIVIQSPKLESSKTIKTKLSGKFGSLALGRGLPKLNEEENVAAIVVMKYIENILHSRLMQTNIEHELDSNVDRYPEAGMLWFWVYGESLPAFHKSIRFVMNRISKGELADKEISLAAGAVLSEHLDKLNGISKQAHSELFEDVLGHNPSTVSRYAKILQNIDTTLVKNIAKLLFSDHLWVYVQAGPKDLLDKLDELPPIEKPLDDITSKSDSNKSAPETGSLEIGINAGKVNVSGTIDKQQKASLKQAKNKKYANAKKINNRKVAPKKVQQKSKEREE